MKTLLILLIVFIYIPLARAESDGIGISIKLDKNDKLRVSIVTSFTTLSAANVTVSEAAEKIAEFQVRGSRHSIGIIVDEDIRLALYFPILDAISQNSIFKLIFLDGDSSQNNYVSSNIRRMIEQDGAGQPATRSQSKSQGSQNPKPESEGRSR